VTYQLCTADHRTAAPTALGGLKLCAGHHAALTEALTGPSAAEDPTVDAVWGIRRYSRVTIYGSRERAKSFCDFANSHGSPLYSELVCGDGITWQTPHAYRPGGLVRDYTALTLRMTGMSTGERAPYVVHSAEAPLPVPDGIAELRSQIRHDLAYWVGCHARTARSAQAPPSGSEPAQLAAWLATYTDWAAAQDWAGLYVNVLSELRAKARRLIDLPRTPQIPVGQCPEHGCDGVLWSAIREEHDARPSLVQCNADEEHQWDSTQWMRLGVRLGRAG
jgi:hypothetical protein